jgi:hypothetical protein
MPYHIFKVITSKKQQSDSLIMLQSQMKQLYQSSSGLEISLIMSRFVLFLVFLVLKLNSSFCRQEVTRTSWRATNGVGDVNVSDVIENYLNGRYMEFQR